MRRAKSSFTGAYSFIESRRTLASDNSILWILSENSTWAELEYIYVQAALI